MSGYSRQIIFTASIAIVIALAIGLGVYYIQPQLGVSTSARSFSSVSLPPSNTSIIHFGCSVMGVSSQSSSVMLLVNTSNMQDIGLNLSLLPSLSFRATTCSYTFIHNSTTVACGVMCGGGVGYEEFYSYKWNLNFSIQETTNPVEVRHNLTVASTVGLVNLFPEQEAVEVYMNSQQITSWHSNPPCYSGEGIESNCMTPNASSLTIELATPIANGTNQLIINSTKELVP